MEPRPYSIVPRLTSDEDEDLLPPSAQIGVMQSMIEDLRDEKNRYKRLYKEEHKLASELNTKLNAAKTEIIRCNEKLEEYEKWKDSAEQVVANCENKYQELVQNWRSNVVLFESKLETLQAELQRAVTASHNKDYVIAELELENASLKRQLQRAQSVVI
jgi:chromosome segregation ATPase